MMTLAIYLIGWLIFVGGVAWALISMHVAQHYVLIAAVILVGIGVVTGATHARSRDRSS